MFFFFIGGIQPKTVTLDKTPRICPICGLNRAYQKRIDHYISIFFIPLIRIKRGEPVLMCDQCGVVSDRFQQGPGWKQREIVNSCPRCGKLLNRDFQYCPYCGFRL